MLWSSKVLIPGQEVLPDPTGRVFSATRRPRKARLPYAACDTHGFVLSSQCSWPTLYQFLYCLRMRDLDRSRGPRACILQIGQLQKVPLIHVNLPSPKTQCEWEFSAVL